MNKVILMGRLTRDPSVSNMDGGELKGVARYTMAVERRVKTKTGERLTDFISCVAFGKAAEFAAKYLHKGIKITISGRIQTGSYTNKNGEKVYTTDVVVEEQEFAESKRQQDATGQQDDGFEDIPDGIEEDMPFA